MASDGPCFRELREDDGPRILATFNEVFAALDRSFRPRDLAWWRRRYLANPSGSRGLLALDGEHRVLAQYAGLGQRLVVDGSVRRASQSVDSMVVPSPGLSRRGLFVRTGEHYAERFGGREPELDALMWGLPVRAAWRIGRRALGYRTVRQLLRLVRRLDAAPAERSTEVAVEEVASFPDEVDGFFERLAPARGVIAVRDRAQLEWRFGGGRYALALARGADGVLRGWAVTTRGALDGRSGTLLVDWLVEPGDEEAARGLRAWAEGRARAAGDPRLVAVFLESCPEWLEFQRAGWRVEPTGYPLVARSYDRDLPLGLLRERWYLTLGDTDLC